MKVSCLEDYHHYAANHSTKPKSNVKMAVFNLLHLGDGMAPGKDIGLLASIINRWDLVAGLEIMRASGSTKYGAHHKVNLEWWKFSKNPTDPSLEKHMSIVSPGYITLLQKLRELDDSWSLILTPYSAGPNTSHQELSGFYYRRAVVEPMKNSYCGGYACYMDMSGKEEKISRPPFVGNFRSGDFTFSAVAYHARFDSITGSALTKTKFKNLILSEIDYKHKKYNPEGEIKTSLEEIFRFVELKLVIEALDHVSSQGRAILLGDFNLERTSANEEAWQEILGDYSLFGEELTSLSDINRYASAYDHILFNPNAVKECQGETVKRLDFTSSEEVPEFEMHWEDRNSHIRSLLREKEECVKLTHSQTRIAPCMSDTKLGEFEDKVRGQLEYNSKYPYAHYKFMVSDHLPVSMECKL